MPFDIRSTRLDDGTALQRIERLAGEQFRDVGLDAVAEDGPRPLGVLAEYAIAGRSWVAVDEMDRPVGYVIVDVVDGNAHIEQVSVAPEDQGVGVGRALIDRVGDWAIDTGRTCITLTTFTGVSWNAPLYQHLGFVAMAESDIGPELRAVRDAETAHGLDPRTRCCMRLDVGS